MTFDIAVLLTQDGLTLGAIYALLALSIVLVFVVTRIIFIPQGEFVAFGALTLAALQKGEMPGTVWLTLVLGAAVVLVELASTLRTARWLRFGMWCAGCLAYPAAMLALTAALAPRQPGLLVQVVLTLALIMPIGPMIHRLAFQPVMGASLLIKLFIAVAVHYVLLGLGLSFFGPEGWRTSSFSNESFALGGIDVSAQSLWIYATFAAMVLALWVFFSRTISGKALRATAANRIGARLVGIRPEVSGRRAFALAALFGAFSGILIAPLTTIYYDSGFLIVLKAVVGAVIGGMTSYPLTAIGALTVGLIESFASFFASAYKEAILFSALIPALLWWSLRHRAEEEQ